MLKIYILLILTLSVLAQQKAGLRTQKLKEVEQDLSQARARILQTATANYELIFSKSFPKFIQNIGFIGQGYNIYYGNPSSTTGIDPGFRNYEVVSQVYDIDPYRALTKDRSLFTPVGYTATHMQSCTIAFSSKAMTSTSQYKSSLGLSASVGGSYGPAAFSASADYKKVESGMSSQESFFIESTAKCSAYNVNLLQGTNSSPGVSPQFADAVRELEALGENPEAYYEFFEEVGTHVTDRAQLGAKFGYRMEMSNTASQKLASQSVDVEASVSYMAVSAKAKTSYEKSQEDQAKTAVSSWTTYSIGNPPTEDNDALKWAARAIGNPMPISVNLISMADYLRVYASALKLRATPAAYNNLIARFDKYANSYCTDRLLKRNIVSSCDFYDITAPVQLKPQVVVNFVDTLANGIINVTFSNRKAAKYLTVFNAKYYINIYLSNNQQKFTLTKINTTDQIYLIKDVASQQCMVLANCSSPTSFITTKACNKNDICQQFKITVYEPNTKEVLVSPVKIPNTSLMVEAEGENAGSQTVFYTNFETNTRIWRLSVAM